MKIGNSSTRWALVWVFAAALLLKAAMPMLASASAQAQGKTLVEVCTVYGVALVPLQEGRGPTPDHHAAQHGGDHCALTALAALAAPAPLTLAVAATLPHETAAPRALVRLRVPDACAAWAAQLEHGPPATA